MDIWREESMVTDFVNEGDIVLKFEGMLKMWLRSFRTVAVQQNLRPFVESDHWLITDFVSERDFVFEFERGNAEDEMAFCFDNFRA